MGQVKHLAKIALWCSRKSQCTGRNSKAPNHQTDEWTTL